MLSVFTGGYLSRKQITLGRLVLDLRNPGQDFCPRTPIEITRENLADPSFEVTSIAVGKEKESSFSLKLSKLFRAKAKADKSLRDILLTQKTIRWELLNSGEFFNNMIQDKQVRIWLERVHKHSPVHFAVGLITVLDASVANASEAATNREARLKSPAGEALTFGSSAAPIVGDAIDVEVEIQNRAAERQNTIFLAPGERIIGVQYRRIIFKGFKSAEVGKAYLDRRSSWVKYLGEDVIRGDNEDIIDATLATKLTLKGLDQQYISELVDPENSEGDILLMMEDEEEDDDQEEEGEE